MHMCSYQCAKQIQVNKMEIDAESAWCEMEFALHKSPFAILGEKKNVLFGRFQLLQ